MLYVLYIQHVYMQKTNAAVPFQFLLGALNLFASIQDYRQFLRLSHHPPKSNMSNKSNFINVLYTI